VAAESGVAKPPRAAARLAQLLLILLAAALLGPAIAAAVAEVLHVLVIAVVALVAVAGTGLVAFGALRLRQERHEPGPPPHRPGRLRCPQSRRPWSRRPSRSTCTTTGTGSRRRTSPSPSAASRRTTLAPTDQRGARAGPRRGVTGAARAPRGHAEKLQGTACPVPTPETGPGPSPVTPQPRPLRQYVHANPDDLAAGRGALAAVYRSEGSS
jgi:hypothetical protein